MGFERILGRLLEYGVLAPSLYNSQPWKFSIDPERGVIGVYADPEKVPAGRDLYLALGACMENMVLAGPALGYEVKEELLLGDSTPHENTLVARLTLKAATDVAPDPLFSTLLIRQTHSGKYKEESVQEIHLDRLRKLEPFSPNEKIYFITEKSALQTLLQLLHDVSHEGSQKQDLIEEGARWINPGSKPLEGLPMIHLGLPLSVKARFSVMRYFGYVREMREVARQTLLRQGHRIEAPAFLLMTTENPTPFGYFNAGRWHARIALTLSEIELAAQTLHLPMVLPSRYPRLKEIFGVSSNEEPVLLLRFGQPERKAWPRTFRRPVEQCVYKPV
jgi:nitroreductase